MTVFDRLTQERRARLVAERRLDEQLREVERLRRELERVLGELHQARRARPAAPAPPAPTAAAPDLGALSQAARLERRVWESVNALWDGFAIFDPQLELVTANEAYLQAFRAFPEVRPGITYERLAEILAFEGLVDTGGQSPRAWVDAGLARLRQTPIPEIELRFATGKVVRIHERRTRGGDLVVVARDITESVRHEAELTEARARAEAASRAKSTFLAKMSHEIRTPMNGVVGMAELLAETALGPEQRLYVETIRSSGEALLSIINDVLDFSKLEADRMVLLSEPFDLERCIHEVAVLLQAGARRRGIALIVDYDLFLPTRFLGDGGRIRQVLTNLVGNAVKFTEAGHVLIRVVGVEEGEGRYRLTVTVEDTGIGIAAENLERIFGEFAQVEEQASRRFEGTGLGLAITRRLLDLMGGRIWVESEPGQGSCFGFSLSLPVAEGAQAAAPAPAGPLRVLLADPSPLGRAILERQLGALGVGTVAVGGAAQVRSALAAAEAPFDLLILDHAPPDLDALALVRDLAAGGSAPPVLVAAANPGDAAAAAAAPGVRGVLARPLLRADLLRALSPPAPEPDAPAEGPAPRPAPPAEGRRALRLLVAEDNRTNQLVVSGMLADLGLELVFADDGQAAVELFGRLRPDLILMDISMPRMDGRAATRAIRQLPGGAQVPILALTAHAVGAGQEDLLDSGMDEVLTKPLRKARLFEALARHAPPDLWPEAARRQAG